MENVNSVLEAPEDVDLKDKAKQKLVFYPLINSTF